MRTPLRYRQFLVPFALALCSVASAQSVGISTNAAVPNTNAILDIDASALGTKRGLLIPRMTAAQRLAIPITAADNAVTFKSVVATVAAGNGLCADFSRLALLIV